MLMGKKMEQRQALPCAPRLALEVLFEQPSGLDQPWKIFLLTYLTSFSEYKGSQESTVGMGESLLRDTTGRAAEDLNDSLEQGFIFVDLIFLFLLTLRKCGRFRVGQGYCEISSDIFRAAKLSVRHGNTGWITTNNLNQHPFEQSRQAFTCLISSCMGPAKLYIGGTGWGGEALAQGAQRSCGCLIPGIVQGQVGALSTLG
ncbi:hypothetical protein TURU_017294 [Turdus rufiventris]|nr:hypothetical protein TURU_017294 [Turdus rufiventris]